jgi:hypothetical protein
MVENTYDRIMKSFIIMSDEEIEVIERRRQLMIMEEDE